VETSLRNDIGQNREELGRNLEMFRSSFAKQILDLTQRNEEKLDKVRGVIESGLRSIQQDNNQQLDRMRETVDEKLHLTLEKRLGESFQLVSERLEKVHQGPGEMQSLAAGVGDLKKVLGNVKTRGILGEVQLGALLEQILTTEQYDRNVMIKKGTTEAIEFAIKFPGRDDQMTLLPIDSKFPIEDYQRLEDARERADLPAVEKAGKDLEDRVKLEAKKIRDKYIDPPVTTDFAILFLPTEGLYAEILRRPGLFDLVQREYKVIMSGPTTLAAVLNSLQMGFRTLAVEKRAAEVWNLLNVIRTEFGKFGDLLEKTQKKLQEAGNTIEDAARKSRTIQNKLKKVEALPETDDKELLDLKKDLEALPGAMDIDAEV
jgi:DNA recombination protein RmuC